MPITYSNAIDEMFGIVNSAVPDITALLTYAADIRWPGTPKRSLPDSSKVWMRVSFQTVDDKQKSLANAKGSRLYRATGLLYIQIFCPRNLANSSVVGRKLGELIRDKFRHASPSGAIEFQNQQVRELPATEQNYPFNVVCTCIFDSVIGPDAVSEATGVWTKHFPVESLNGVRTSFTFNNLPASSINYQLFYNGEEMESGFTQLGAVITLEVAPNAANNDSLVAYY